MDDKCKVRRYDVVVPGAFQHRIDKHDRLLLFRGWVNTFLITRTGLLLENASVLTHGQAAAALLMQARQRSPT